VVSTPETCGGSPRIDGTRVTVRAVVARVLQQGESPEEFASAYSVTLAQVYAALSYYYDHRGEIDHEITENSEEFWQAKLGGAWNPSDSSSTKT
jgi:uncharacterized protein (DUF433 family)